ncbi:unnamed protein product [Rotaria magnacalcarata]|uniref:FAM234A/B beta-propeller domain-containing protein n=5 Tax=Rotaria magnacalcarata TaxID=392030 RepID=A0A816QYT6_9BILA|nr:unnamed protein product [Rotaria magnacalcarata]CAF2067106.1 unnamed protein product [Rotaria magnacalcarata]CAF2230906.1 unnamed protein product [Rotaria magnacalcarata]CAF3762874.1 unnamed protein product [Rotaria magnacalcarata]CAF3797063.1 unnamed protein product [Rotaria magnacalcarata]
MFTDGNSTENGDLLQSSAINDDQGTLLDDNATTVQNDYALAYRNRQYDKRPLRFFLCCTFSTALILATVIVLLSSIVYHSNKEKTYNENVQIEVIWTSGFPKLITETAFRLVDCNSDGILDVIFGFGTGVDALGDNRLLCDLYFNGIHPCNGGVRALDGRNGQLLWSYDKSHHEVFALNCQRDIDGDHIPDCVTGGRGGTFEAISGKTGSLIWTFDNDVRIATMNFYTPLYLNKDFDNDGLNDLVTIHGGDPIRKPHDTVRLAGEVLLVSAKTGKLLNVSIVPDKMESYYSPQLLQRSAEEEYILVGTGGETHGGGLYALDVKCFSIQCSSPYIKIINDEYKGVMTPPVLVDVNNDDIEDIIIPLYNSTLFAFDGKTFRQLWNRTFPSSETYSSPAVGYFNDDDIPDIMVHYQTGPGYPLYYSAQTTILDGLTGEPILDRSIEQTVGVQSSPLTISFKQRGHDMFIYWMGECDVVDSSKERKIDYDKNAPSVLLSQADICKLRYQTTSFTALHGLTQSMKPPGILIYNSNHHVALERSTTKPSSIDVENFLQQYPDYVSVYKSWQRLDNYMQNQDVADTTPSTLADDNNDEPSLTDDSDENDNADDAEFRSSRKKYKRHVGPHDNGGLQRIISTGTLAPSFEPNSKSTIDLIFATYWIPSDTSTLLAANERTCIEDGMAKEEERLKSTNANFYGMDHDAYEHYIEDLCTNKTRLYETVLKISPDIISQVQASMLNPFRKQFGQLTIYRIRLHFKKNQCEPNKTRKCSSNLDNNNDLRPFEQQIWPAYMGINGDCHANNRLSI